jgi:long-chain acyl-CoA synthetase
VLSGAPRPGRYAPTAAAVFLAQAALLAARPFAHHHREGRWQEVTWIELREQALRTASGLVTAGVEVGDRVLLLTGSRVEWLACDLGIQLAGAATVAVRPSASPEAAQAIAKRSGAVLAIVSGEELAARLHLTGTLGRIVRVDGEVARWLRTPFGGPSSDEVGGRLAALGPDDVASVDFPRGTPAGVAVTHGELVDRADRFVEAFEVGPNDRVLSFLRCATVSERLWGLGVPAAAGASVWLARGMPHLEEDVQATRPTLIRCTPAVLDAIRQGAEEEWHRRPARRGALVPWAIATSRERANAPRPDLRLRLRHRLADRLVLSSLRRRAGGGRLRCFAIGEGPLPGPVEEFFRAIGLPVRRGCGLEE